MATTIRLGLLESKLEAIRTESVGNSRGGAITFGESEQACVAYMSYSLNSFQEAYIGSIIRVLRAY